MGLSAATVPRYRSAVDYLTGEIRRAAEAGLWHVALQASLAGIDICAALSSEDGETTGQLFRSWCSRWIGDKPLPPEDLWQLRCGMLHQGRFKYKNTPRIVFTVPAFPGTGIHGNSIEGLFQLDLLEFCDLICYKIDTWWHLCKEDEPVRTNAERLVRERPEGVRGLGNTVIVIA